MQCPPECTNPERSCLGFRLSTGRQILKLSLIGPAVFWIFFLLITNSTDFAGRRKKGFLVHEHVNQEWMKHSHGSLLFPWQTHDHWIPHWNKKKKKKGKKSKRRVYLQLRQWSRGGWKSEPQKGAASLPPPCRREVGEYTLFFGRASIKTSFSSWSESVFTAKASASVLDFCQEFSHNCSRGSLYLTPQLYCR